jgi:hypothetical protein
MLEPFDDSRRKEDAEMTLWDMFNSMQQNHFIVNEKNELTLHITALPRICICVLSVVIRPFSVEHQRGENQKSDGLPR